MQERILTPEQVSQILQVHPFTVLKFIKQGRLKASKLGRVYRIRESDLEGFLDQTSGREPKAPEDPTNNIKKSKNKNKSLSIPQAPPSPIEDQSSTKIVEEQVTSTKVDVIENEKGEDKRGGGDEYFILQ